MNSSLSKTADRASSPRCAQNAAFSFLVLWHHPSFTSGVASAIVMDGFDGDGELCNGGSSGAALRADGGSFDPASAAARARDAALAQETLGAEQRVD